MDVALTHEWIDLGVSFELNPIAAFLVSKHFFTFAVWKVFSVGVGAAYLAGHDMRLALKALITIYTLVCLSHILVLIYVG